MSIEFTKVDSSTRAAFYETLLAFWNRPWEPDFQREFLAWRYENRTDGETLVAMSGGTCIGLIDTFIRPYIIAGRTVLVREPCDWYCDPAHRGAGMRLMRYLISQGQPMLGVGLPEAAVAIAARMKWSHALDTHDFILPITARRVVGALLRKSRLGDGSASRHIPRGLKLRPLGSWNKWRPEGGEVEAVVASRWPQDDQTGDDYCRPQNGAATEGPVYAVTPLLTRRYVQWLSSGPTELGEVFCLAFRIDGVLVGISVTRIEQSKVGRKARLIHLQSFRPDVATLRWMIAENARRSTEREAESVHCRSSCQVTNDALRSLGFRETGQVPVITSFNDLPVLPGSAMNVTFLRGDDAMIPTLIAE